jgi:ADP-L-glycero-D-manno-heptose 6-epimerase
MILLTGAAGFIGSNVLAALNRMGIENILCADDLTNGAKCQNLAGRKFYHYCDYRELLQIVEADNWTAVIHLGANADTTCSNGREIVNDNYNFTMKLFELASTPVFIYASSAAVYGKTNWPHGAKETAVHERPKSPYAVSKWMVDEQMRRFIDMKIGTKLIGLRFFNVYGPGEQHKGRMASFAHHAFSSLKNNTAPKLFTGSENIMRDFVYIDDVVDVVDWARVSDTAPNGIYNVGTGAARSFLSVALGAMRIADSRLEPQFVPFPEDLRENYQDYTCASLEKLRAAGYQKNFLSLETGLQKYWDTSYAFQL